MPLSLPRGRLALAAAWLWLASPAAASSISFDKGPIVLGKTESVGVTIRVDEPEGAQERPLRLAVNVGSFGPVARVRPGQYRSVYVPPSTRFPQVALVAVWRETGPEAPIDFLRVPLHGTTRIPVKAKRGSEVMVELGPDRFGPVIVDRSGQAQVPVIIPPQVTQAVLIVKEPKRPPTHGSVPVGVPQYNRLTAALVPHALIADGESSARLDVFYDLGGADVPPERLKVTASVGAAVLEQASRGRYVFRYTPPAGAPAKRVEFQVSVEGDPTARAQTGLTLGLPPPSRLVLRPPEETLSADGRTTSKVAVLAFDSTGLGLIRQRVQVTANGQRLEPVADQGGGLYEAPYRTPSEYPPGGLVQFAATAGEGEGKVSAQVNYQLMAPAAPKSLTALVDPAVVPADGRTQAVVQLEVKDGAGLPLRGARLFVVATHGTVGTVSELGEGRYQSTYVPPPAAPPGDAVVKVVDSTGAFEQTIPVRLRPDPGRLLVGLRGGLTHSLGELYGPRGGVELAIPLRAGSSYLALGATATVGHASQQISSPDGLFQTRSEALFVPASLRLSYELLSSRALALHLGAGGVAAFAQFSTSLTQSRTWRWGFGGLAFASAALPVGPGQAFLELSYAIAGVRTADDDLDVGGAGAELGYRIAVF